MRASSLLVLVLFTACGSNAAGDARSGAIDAGVSPSSPGSAPAGDGDAGLGSSPSSSSGDGGGATDPVLCGAAACRDGTTCVSGACELPGCSGYQVPGDYATVQAAATALQDVGGTICVGAGTFDEHVFLNARKPVVVHGVSAAKTTVRSFGLGGQVEVKGLATTETSTATSATKVSFAHVKLASTTGAAFLLNGNVGGRQAQDVRFFASTIAGGDHGIHVKNAQSGDDRVTVEACDLSTKTGSALWLEELTSSQANPPVTVTVTSSWIHDSPTGVLLSAVRGCNSCPYPNTAVTDAIQLVNDTFTTNAVAVSVSTERLGTSRLDVHNTLFVKNGLAISASSAVVVATGNNLFFGNATNYEGVVDGPATLKVDPLLDGAAPPRLGATSPARGAGDETRAPPKDFWGRARGASVDLGAVEAN